MKYLVFIGLALWLNLASASNTAWQATEKEASGQTVYFNAWGGGDAVNAYIQWAAAQVKTRYGVQVRHVKITDAAEVVKRIQTEVAAGRKSDGSVDLMWVNGENFRNLKNNGLLFGPWAENVPNWPLVDLTKPVRVDFSVPTDGYELPWGTAQLTLIADRTKTPTPPRSAAEWLAYATANPGRLSYPKPPEFHGTTFLKQLLLELAPETSVLQQPVNPKQFDVSTQALWQYLDALHPHLWRNGKAFPSSAAEMHRMLGDGELLVSISFNPNEAANLISKKQLPRSAYSFGFTKGTIGNVHFVAIPANARAKAGAQVFANFLLSPQAQIHKADIAVWGDGSVLKNAARQTAAGALADAVPTLPEPHASWVEALESAWLQRYSTR